MLVFFKFSLENYILSGIDTWQESCFAKVFRANLRSNFSILSNFPHFLSDNTLPRIIFLSYFYFLSKFLSFFYLQLTLFSCKLFGFSILDSIFLYILLRSQFSSLFTTSLQRNYDQLFINFFLSSKLLRKTKKLSRKQEFLEQ